MMDYDSTKLENNIDKNVLLWACFSDSIAIFAISIAILLLALLNIEPWWIMTAPWWIKTASKWRTSPKRVIMILF